MILLQSILEKIPVLGQKQISDGQGWRVREGGLYRGSMGEVL